MRRLNRALEFPLDCKEIKKICMFESFLLFCFEKLAETNIKRCPNCLKKYHKCGKNQFNELDFLLDNIYHKYAAFSKRSNFNENLSFYLRIDEGLKMFAIENDTLILKDIDKSDSRYKEYREFWIIEEESKRKIINYDTTICNYTFRYKGVEYPVNLNDVEFKDEYFPTIKKKKGIENEFMLNELLQYAQEMDGKFLNKNYVQRLNRSGIKLLEDGVLHKSVTLKLDKITHILGMVGSGKSTLMHILSYCVMRNKGRVMLVLETVKEVHEISQLFQQLGFSTAVITGKSTIEKQIDQVSVEGDQVLSLGYSAYYTGACPLQGAIDNYSRLNRIALGSEPCHSLIHKDKKYTCPFYFSCPRKAEERKIATADLLITTVHSLIYGKAPTSSQSQSSSLLEFVHDYIDLVMFDEVDKVQVSLDDIFSQIYSLKKLVMDNYNKIHDWESHVYQSDYNELILRLSTSFHNFKQYQFKIHQLLEETDSKSILTILKEKKCVTPEIMIEKLVVSQPLRESLISYLKGDNEQNEEIKRVLGNFENSLLGTGNSSKVEFSNLKHYFPNMSLNYIEFKFIILFISLDKTLKEFFRAYETLEYEEKQDVEVPRITVNPFKRIQNFVPEAPLEHIYGYIYDNENKDLMIFRQFGLGRSVLLDLPFMKLTNKGEVLGPSVVLFSGTSFSPESYRFHIEREVKYILEPNKEIQEFIKQLEIEIIPTGVKVSGTENKERYLEEILKVCQFKIEGELNQRNKILMKQLEIEIIPTGVKVSGTENKERYLEEILKVCQFKIEGELNQRNKILMIVNSYDQCQRVKEIINDLWNDDIECFALTPDTLGDGTCEIKRGNVEKLDEIAADCQILIAPATAIERGFNIVGEDGHSLFSALFFLVRPMEGPKDDEIAADCQILIAPATAIERGFNIVGEDGHSLFSALFFLVRPMEGPKDLQRLMIQINGLTYSRLKEYQKNNESIDYYALAREINQLWTEGLKEYYEIGNMPDILKNDIVISRFILIMQIVGRLLRITQLDKTPPRIYFADEAFTKSGTSNFNMLAEVCQYIEKLLKNDNYKELAELLYLPFYEALKKGLGKYE